MIQSDTIKLSKKELIKKFSLWLKAWDRYDLSGIMELIHEDILFENWDGSNIKGKNLLKKAWAIWFSNHGNFKFINEEIFVDEEEQKLLFKWKLEWPSREDVFKGELEIRQGVDVIQFVNGKIIKKSSYSKTKIQIGSKLVTLNAHR